MNKYKIHCTKEQTEKAWELGAPLFCLDEMQSEGFDENPYKDDYKDRTKLSIGLYAFCPTAEEMVGWLEEHKIFVHISPCVDISCSYHISSKGYNKYGYTSNIMVCKTRREATLAAIDAALEYLVNK